MHNCSKDNTSLSIRNRYNQFLPPLYQAGATVRKFWASRHLGSIFINEIHTYPKGDPQVLNQASALMPEALSPDVVVYLCTNCIPQGVNLPRQWNQDGSRILVREVPCSGKMEGQYLLHALEGGARGLCVVACPKGDCHLSQGNYRAEIRIRTVQRLLEEIGLPPERAQLVHFSPADPPQQLEQLVRSTVERICALGENPLRAAR
jgi:coenzyme F420-reducing hydrogenase delta subunit